MSRPLSFITTALVCILLLTSCDNDHPKKIQGYIEGRFTYLAPTLPGQLEQRFVSRGSMVLAGDKLAILDQEPQLSELEEAKKNLLAASEKLIDLTKGSRYTILNSIGAQIAQAKADRALAKVTMQRNRSLYRSGAISKERYDEKNTDYQVQAKRVQELESNLAEAELGSRVNVIAEQAARVEAAKATVKQLEWELSEKTIYAPTDGLVFDTFFRKGEFVESGQAILAMLSPDHIYLIFFLPEPLLSSIKIGEKVTFSCDGCKKSQLAQIYFISPNAEYTPPVIFTKESRHKLVYRVEARIPRDKAFKIHPGQPVDVFLPRSA